MSVRSFLRDIFALLLLYKQDNLIIPILYWGPQVLRCSCTLASVLLATGVELSMRMCEHLELILVLPPRRQDCLLAPAANSRHLDPYLY